jgi:hypothetical protein
MTTGRREHRTHGLFRRAIVYARHFRQQTLHSRNGSNINVWQSLRLGVKQIDEHVDRSEP